MRMTEGLRTRPALEMSERELTRTALRAASAKIAEATPESHVPRLRARVDTILPFCAGRLSWRHRACPSTTLHETQACPLRGKTECFVFITGVGSTQARLQRTAKARISNANYCNKSCSARNGRNRSLGFEAWGVQSFSADSKARISWRRCARNPPPSTMERRWCCRGCRASRRPLPGSG